MLQQIIHNLYWASDGYMNNYMDLEDSLSESKNFPILEFDYWDHKPQRANGFSPVTEHTKHIRNN